MFTTILVPLDGSSRAEAALLPAARLAHHTGATLVLIRVVSFVAEALPAIMTCNPLLAKAVVEADLAEVTTYLERVAAFPNLRGIPVKSTMYHGPAATTLLEAASALQSDLIVLTRQGITGLTRWIMGSVAEKIVRQASVPVLVVPEGFTHLEAHLLIPLDGSINAQAALEPGVTLLTALADPGQKVALHLVQVVKPPRVEEGEASGSPQRSAAFAQAKHTMRQTVTLLQEGSLAPCIAQQHLLATWSVLLDTDVASALLRVAEAGEDTEGAGASGGCELIAISTHGRGGLPRWVMGSVTERVLAATKRPILIVHPTGAPGPREHKRQEKSENHLLS